MAELYGGQPQSFTIQAAATAPIAGAVKKESWLDAKHPLYTKMSPRWDMVCDFYYGEVADRDVAAKYLVQRYQGEPQKAYDERLARADYTPHLGTIIDTLAGMLFAVEDRTTRVWADESGGGLGDPLEPGTPAHNLMYDADGRRTSWSTVWRQFALDIILFQYMWVLVDTVNGRHVVKLVSPRFVPNWTDDGAQVLMEEKAQRVGSLLDATSDAGKRFILWTPTGWTRFTQTDKGDVITNEAGFYKYVNKNNVLVPPIFRVELPLRRYVAWLLAKKNAVIYNNESIRDFGLLVSSFAKLILAVETDEQLDGLLDRLAKGHNVLPEKGQGGGHRYIAPSSEPTRIATEVLKEKRDEFWTSGFKMYADAAREKTATEVRQDVASGVGAFLQLLKASVDDAENGAMWLLEQAIFSQSPNKWGVTHVERTDDFSSVDIAAVLDVMRKRYLGETEPVPVGRQALVQLAKDSARYDGLSVNNFEIEAAVDGTLIAKYIQNLDLLGVTPPIVKARLAIRLAAALGLVDPQEVVENDDGEKVSLLKILEREAMALAETQNKAAERMSELPPFERPPVDDSQSS
jgi:hypothetical protein